MEELDLDALATECMESDDTFVQGQHTIAGTSAKTAEAVPDRRSKQLYARSEAVALVNAVSEAHPHLTALGVLQVAARVAERARIDEEPA